jgi:glycerophosphoryl diester phosphodiesterase
VTGGPGADQFWLLTDSQDIPAMAQTITDFTVGEDVIGFATTGFSFADLNITQNGSSTVVTLTETDKDLAILLNTQVSQITESSFTFV